jgi:hypothetical protein
LNGIQEVRGSTPLGSTNLRGEAEKVVRRNSSGGGPAAFVASVGKASLRSRSKKKQLHRPDMRLLPQRAAPVILADELSILTLN